MSYCLLWFDRTGPARYLSHLDTARALLRTFARAGIQLALTEGFRPKPRFALGLPLPVGAAGLGELAVAQLPEEAEGRGRAADGGRVWLADTLRALRAAAPEGLGPRALTVSERKPHPHPVWAVYECDLHVDPRAAGEAAAWFGQQESVEVERRSPKGRRVLDLSRFVTDLAVTAVPGAAHLRFTVRHRADGAARPQEVADLLAGRAGGEPVMYRLTRTRVGYEGLPRGTKPGGEE